MKLNLNKELNCYLLKKLFVLLFAAAAFTACGDASDLASAVEGAVEDAAEQVDAAADDCARGELPTVTP